MWDCIVQVTQVKINLKKKLILDLNDITNVVGAGTSTIFWSIPNERDVFIV